MIRTDDPVADYMAYDAEQQRRMEQLPVCSYCREEIQDDYYFEINEEPVCEQCLNEFFRKAVEDYVE